jgi:hypothetical protein
LSRSPAIHSVTRAVTGPERNPVHDDDESCEEPHLPPTMVYDGSPNRRREKRPWETGYPLFAAISA